MVSFSSSKANLKGDYKERESNPSANLLDSPNFSSLKGLAGKVELSKDRRVQAEEKACAVSERA
jgi:hypothetical protein